MAKQVMKKTNGFGTVRKRADGRWEARYTEPMTRKQKSVYGKTKAEVRKKLTEIQKDIDLKQYIISSDTTFDDLCEFYFNTVKKYEVKPQTLSGYRLRYKNVFKDYIGDKPVQKITETDLYKVVCDSIDSGKSKSYIKSACVSVKEVFNFAIEKKMILENPMQYVRYNMGKPEQVKRELSPEELHWFFLGVKERFGRHTILFKTLLYTGMRVSELCSLRWEDIDGDFRFLHIRNNLTRYQDDDGKYIQTFCTPKTEASRRDIPIMNELQEDLKEYKNNCETNMKLWGRELDKKCLIFMPEPKASPETPFDRGRITNIMDTTFKYLSATYGVELERFTPHYFRHKFISVAMREKMPLKDIMNIIGHSEVKTLLKVYTHTQNEYMLESINALPKMYE